jgi:hypothetical protein
MTIAFTTLFTRIGKAVKAANALIAAVYPSLRTNLRAFEDELDTADHDFRQDVLGTVESSLDNSFSTIGDQLATLIGTPVSNLIIETVHADVPLIAKTINNALDELILQMEENSETVQSSVISNTITYGRVAGSSSGTSGDNTGDGKFVFCDTRGDGRVNEFILAETIRCEVTSANTSGTATWTITCQPSFSLLNPSWPGGSGITTSLTTATGSSGNTLTNGTMEEESDNEDDIPEDWIVETGTAGTTIKLTDVEIQTVTINGTPTGGYYTLTFTDKYGHQHTTDPLDHDATASELQTALQELLYLGSISVSSTGTSPNLTHSVTFTDVPNPTALTYMSALTGGSPTITIATPTPSSGYVVRGARCLELVGNGSETTALLTSVSLSGNTCYAMNLWAAVDVIPAAGVLEVALVDGVSGDIIADDQGVDNSFTVDLTAGTTWQTAYNGSFHTPLTLPRAVYLRIKLTTALSSGTSVFLDELCLTKATRLYSGGPYLAVFSGNLEFELEDYVEIAITNDRNGLIHEWLHRLLNLSGKDLMLPTAASPTQDDSLAS